MVFMVMCLLELQSDRIGLRSLLVVPFRGPFQRLDRAGDVEVEDGVELLRERLASK